MPIRNNNTRIAYYHAIGQFLDWRQKAGFRHLEDIEPIHVAAYIEAHGGSAATIKQHMAAIRMLFSWLTEKGILAMNPAREVRRQNFRAPKAKRRLSALSRSARFWTRSIPATLSVTGTRRSWQPWPLFSDWRRGQSKGARLLSERETNCYSIADQRRQVKGIPRPSPS